MADILGNAHHLLLCLQVVQVPQLWRTAGRHLTRPPSPLMNERMSSLSQPPKPNETGMIWAEISS